MSKRNGGILAFLILAWIAAAILFPQLERASNIVQPSPPGGPAGGDLSGTYPNPAVAQLNSVPLSTAISLNTRPLTNTYTAGAGGTTAGLLLTLDASGNVITAATNSTTVIGVAMSTVVATASVEVATQGLTTCIAGGTINRGELLVPSAVTAGRCDDSLATVVGLLAATFQPIGRAQAAATVGNPVSIILFGGGTTGGGNVGAIGPTRIPYTSAITGSLLGSANLTFTSATNLLTALGGMKGAGTIATGTKFTTTGCSVSATTGGATAGTYTSGTTGTCTVVITMNGATGLTSPTGWACSASDRNTPADIQQNTTSNTTTATISGPTLSGDVVSFLCIGF